MEFLGDRVLGLVIAEEVIDRYPKESEGSLARRLARLASKPTLARIARNNGLTEMVQTGAGETLDDVTGDGILADATEAVLAAIYLDGSLEAARPVIKALWAPMLEELVQPPRDPKTALQEWAQARQLPLPDYRIVRQVGPAHAPSFEVSVTLPPAKDGTPRTANGEGRNKRQAEFAAAKALLRDIGQ